MRNLFLIYVFLMGLVILVELLRFKLVVLQVNRLFYEVGLLVGIINDWGYIRFMLDSVVRGGYKNRLLEATGISIDYG